MTDKRSKLQISTDYLRFELHERYQAYKDKDPNVTGKDFDRTVNYSNAVVRTMLIDIQREEKVKKMSSAIDFITEDRKKLGND